MNEEKKKGLVFLGILAVIIYFLTRPKVQARYTQGVGTMTPVQLAGNYKEMMSNALRIYINPTDENDPTTGTPWAIDLAHYTKNYEAVKKLYNQYYGRDLSTDLIAWFEPIELSQFVAALQENNQVMS
jgi:hypothetical protein